MNKILLTLLSLVLIGSAYAGVDKKGKEKKAKTPKMEDGMYAKITTNKGVIMLKLEFEKTPMTVANFIGLAEGDFMVDTISYDSPFYDSVTFHRVIPNFMIQGGDPQGTGSGGPKHRMYDETRADLKHSGPGILSMANSDPQGSKQAYGNTGMTNGSQFFITHKATPHLDGLHTVFGHVVRGQDVVNKIANGDVMISVEIMRIGKAAKKFDATAAYKQESFFKTPEGQIALVAQNKATIASESEPLADLKEKSAATTKEKKKAKIDAEISRIETLVAELTAENAKIEAAAIEKERAEAEKAYMMKISKMSVQEYNEFFYTEIKKSYPEAKQTASGLVYVIQKEGTGDKISKDAKVSIHVAGNFRKDGKKFFSTHDAPGKPMDFTYLKDRMVPGWEEGLLMLGAGGEGTFFLPYHLAYGAQGRGGKIPPFSDLIFASEILSVTPAPPVDPNAPKIVPPVQEDHSGHNHDGHNHDGHNH